MEEKTIKNNVIFEGNVVKLSVDDIVDYYGNPARREVVDHSGGVGIITIDDDENILLIEQYRYAIKQNLLEIPAGKLEINEDPLECAKRELVEETGFEALEFISLGEMWPSPGYLSEKLYLYIAKKLNFVGQNFDSGEYVEVKKIKLDKAYNMVLNNEIIDGKSQIAILKLYNYIKERA